MCVDIIILDKVTEDGRLDMLYKYWKGQKEILLFRIIYIYLQKVYQKLYTINQNLLVLLFSLREMTFRFVSAMDLCSKIFVFAHAPIFDYKTPYKSFIDIFSSLDTRNAICEGNRLTRRLTSTVFANFWINEQCSNDKKRKNCHSKDRCFAWQFYYFHIMPTMSKNTILSVK